MNTRELIADLYRDVLDEAPRTPDRDGLITFLIERLHLGPGCDGTHRLTVDILREFGRPPLVIERFLVLFRERGGYGDCEVLFNVFLLR
jgi:Protein of unknown function (DUF2695)